MSSDGPPWYIRDPQTGEIQILGVPERLQSHPDLRRRGLVPVEPLKPGFVYITSTEHSPQYAIKILDLETNELAIYERLLQLDPASPNHTLPCELSQLGHPLLIMPRLGSVYSFRGRRRWTLYEVLGVFLQIVEGVEFLHQLNIAHMDICRDNVIGAHTNHAREHNHVEGGKIYIIDFGSSNTYPLGPGKQQAVTLPPTQVSPPNGLKHFDPYSWDVYCVARVLEAVFKVCLSFAKMKSADDHAWIAKRYIKWLTGIERGCSGVCRCRPTARRARQMLTLLRALVYIPDLCIRSVQSVRGMLSSFLPVTR
ncbi:hypothetical protein BV20DRAFT_955088 [Pilatotrama ljubarskyi]|nr:hypothetical protein BV20DRAFT_955088 [Pilatotrama ljubarskyi]